MTMPVMGPEPAPFVLKLPKYEDFVAEIVIPELDENGDPIPAILVTDTVRLYFPDISPPVTWAGTLVPDDITPTESRMVLFDVDETLVAAVRDDDPNTARLQFIRGARKIPWGTSVKVELV